MSIDFAMMDRLTQKFEQAPNGKSYARTYDGATIVYEDEITGVVAGQVPGEINDVFAAQRHAVLLGGRQVVSNTDPLTGGIEYSAGGFDITQDIASMGIRESVLRVATFGDSTANFGGTSAGMQNTSVEKVSMAAGLSSVVVIDWGLGPKLQLPYMYPSARVVGNGGIGGDTTANMLARDAAAAAVTRRALDDVFATSPDLIIVRAGSINDVLGLNLTDYATQGQLDTIAARHYDIVIRCADHVAYVIDEGIAGFDNNTGTIPPNLAYIRDALARLNIMYGAFITSTGRKNIRFLDPVGVTCDSTGAFLPGVVPVANGYHDSWYGAYRRGKAEAQLVEKMAGASRGYQANGQNLLGTRSNLQVNGSLPTGMSWTLSGCTSAQSGIKLVDGKVVAYNRGNAQAAGGYILMSLPNVIYSGAAAPNITVDSGDQLLYEVDVEILTNDGSVLPQGIYSTMVVDIYNNTSGRFVTTVGAQGTAQDAPFDVSSIKLHQVSPVIEINDVTANLINTCAWTTRIYLPAFSAGFEMRVGKPSIRKVV